jgi:glycosyltransferase involved in cell wall biosynthesis
MMQTMSRIRILFVVNRAVVSGTEQHLLLLLKFLNRDLFEPAVICLSQGPLLDIVAGLKIPIWSLPRKKLLDTGVATKIYNIIRHNEFHIIHSHSGVFACAIGRFLAGAKVIETRHGLCIDYDALNSLSWCTVMSNRCKLMMLHKTLTVCEADRSVLLQKFNGPADKIQTVLNGVDLDAFAKDRAALDIRQDLGIAQHEKIVGTIARFTAQKGLRYLPEAYTRIKSQLSDTKFVVVGDGPLRDALKEQIQLSGLNNDVIFTGYRDDAVQLLSGFDIFVLPSLWEGIPYTILEALALRIPVIATDVFGNREVIEHERTGILIPPRDSGSIASSVVHLLKNAKKAKQLAENGFSLVEKKFSAQEMTRKIERIYLNLVDQQ